MSWRHRTFGLIFGKLGGRYRDAKRKTVNFNPHCFSDNDRVNEIWKGSRVIEYEIKHLIFFFCRILIRPVLRGGWWSPLGLYIWYVFINIVAIFRFPGTHKNDYLKVGLFLCTFHRKLHFVHTLTQTIQIELLTSLCQLHSAKFQKVKI